MLLPQSLAWIRAEGGHRLDAALRRRLFNLYRPPRWLPCWFHGLWFFIVTRFTRLSVIISVEGDCDHVEQTLRAHKVKGVAHMPHLGCLAAHRVSPDTLRAVCGCTAVTRVWPDLEVRAFLDTAVPATGSVFKTDRYTGRGVTIAVMDTGIHPHPDLKDRIIGFRDLVGRRTAPYDDNGHGTHVAGCAAGDGSQSNRQYRGPAPEAFLVGVKVLNKIGSGTTSAILGGIDWVIENRNRYNIRVLNISLGARATVGCAGDPLCQAVGRAWEAGITVVAAAGNEGPEARTVSTPGISPRIITVGAMDDQGTPDRSDDTLASFSSRGPTPDGASKPDILAPGVGITSLRAPGSYVDKSNRETRVGDWYATLSGTSMATPVIAGMVAAMLEAQPALTPDEVKSRLLATAEDRGLAPDEQGAGYVNADAIFAQMPM